MNALEERQERAVWNFLVMLPGGRPARWPLEYWVLDAALRDGTITDSWLRSVAGEAAESDAGAEVEAWCEGMLDRLRRIVHFDLEVFDRRVGAAGIQVLRSEAADLDRVADRLVAQVVREEVSVGTAFGLLARLCGEDLDTSESAVDRFLGGLRAAGIEVVASQPPSFADLLVRRMAAQLNAARPEDDGPGLSQAGVDEGPDPILRETFLVSAAAGRDAEWRGAAQQAAQALRLGAGAEDARPAAADLLEAVATDLRFLLATVEGLRTGEGGEPLEVAIALRGIRRAAEDLVGAARRLRVAEADA